MIGIGIRIAHVCGLDARLLILGTDIFFVLCGDVVLYYLTDNLISSYFPPLSFVIFLHEEAELS